MPKALVIDDARVMRLIPSHALSAVGFETHEAANGQDGLAALESHTDVSLAMVDWNMPEMNGLEFLRRVRSDPRFSGLKVVMVTTETEVEQVARALEEGADEYVMKPFTEDIIADKLRLLGLIS